MSESSKLVPDTQSVGDKLRDSLDLKEAKPDIGNPDVGSPVTPLQTRSSGRTSAAITTTSSSCSSSSSGSDRAVQTPVTRKHDSSQSTISSAAQTTSSNPAGPQLKSSSASAAQSLKTTAQSPKSTTLPSPKSTAVPSPKSTAPSSAAQSKSNTPSGTKSSKSTTPSAAKSGSSSSSPKAATGNQKPGRGSSSSDSTSGAAKSSCKSSPAPQQPIKIVPAGNLFPSGNVQITGMTQGNITTKCMDPKPGEKIYGYGSIIRGNIPSRAKLTASVSSPVIAGNSAGGSDADTLWKTVMSSSNPEEVTKLGNEMFKKDRFIEALKLCDRAVELAPTNATYHNNRATLLSALGRIGEAVIEFEEAIQLDPKFVRAHHNFAALLLRLGQVDDAGMHLFSVEDPSDPTVVTMLELVDEHLSKCTDARSRCEWNIVLTEANAAMESGADSSPQLGMCKVEALLKLLRLDDAQTVLASVHRIESLPDSFSQTRFFNMIGEAYVSFVKSHLELALGRFENAVTAAEKASIIDSKNNEVETWYRDVKLITRARDRGNNLYESERYTEAMSAYTEGLKIDPSNATLFCHRADCFFKVGMWESSIEDYNHALLILPSYTKPRLQRAASYIKLENWAEALKDYEALRMEMPYDEEIAESLFQAQVELKKSRGEVVEEISSLEELKTALNRPGVSFVYFYRTSDEQCKQLCVFMDALCIRYPSLHFLKVEIEKYPAVGDAERVGFEPTFKIYKHGARRMEIVCPCQEMLENSVIQYNR